MVALSEKLIGKGGESSPREVDTKTGRSSSFASGFRSASQRTYMFTSSNLCRFLDRTEGNEGKFDRDWVGLHTSETVMVGVG